MFWGLLQPEAALSTSPAACMWKRRVVMGIISPGSIELGTEAFQGTDCSSHAIDPTLGLSRQAGGEDK